MNTYTQNPDGSISTTQSITVDLNFLLRQYTEVSNTLQKITDQLTAIGQQIPAVAPQITTAVPALSQAVSTVQESTQESTVTP